MPRILAAGAAERFVTEFDIHLAQSAVEQEGATVVYGGKNRVAVFVNSDDTADFIAELTDGISIYIKAFGICNDRPSRTAGVGAFVGDAGKFFVV